MLEGVWVLDLEVVGAGAAPAPDAAPPTPIPPAFAAFLLGCFVDVAIMSCSAGMMNQNTLVAICILTLRASSIRAPLPYHNPSTQRPLFECTLRLNSCVSKS